MEVNASDLAKRLELSKGRISQLVASGTFDGCFIGEGRARRFDPESCAHAIGRKTDPGQRLGNGAKTMRAIGQKTGSPSGSVASASSGKSPNENAKPALNVSGYELARMEKAQEEVKRLARLNAEADGTFVLAEVAAREARRQITQEVGEIAGYIRETARALADEMGVDYLVVRKLMLDRWRKHRSKRSEVADSDADAAQFTDKEIAVNL